MASHDVMKRQDMPDRLGEERPLVVDRPASVLIDHLNYVFIDNDSSPKPAADVPVTRPYYRTYCLIHRPIDTSKIRHGRPRRWSAVGWRTNEMLQRVGVPTLSHQTCYLTDSRVPVDTPMAR